jgi:coenzyme PQQ precursor peptide PqqA
VPVRSYATLDLPHLRGVGRGSRFDFGAAFAPISWEDAMTWKTPKIVEVPVGMEINMYACAARK